MGFRRVRLLVGCCCFWGFEEERDRFLVSLDACAALEGCGVVSMGSGAIVFSLCLLLSLAFELCCKS